MGGRAWPAHDLSPRNQRAAGRAHRRELLAHVVLLLLLLLHNLLLLCHHLLVLEHVPGLDGKAARAREQL